MIENIRSHEGEDQGNKRGNYTFKPPKNIKQIGESTSQKKIYVEDYVFTYIKELVKKEYAGCKIAVLLGQYMKAQDCRIIMINGAVEAQGIQYDGDNVFNNDTWTDVYEKIKRYFTGVEVVGWCIGGPGFILENDEKLKKIHLDNFAGVDKALLKYDNLEGEESFYIYEHGTLNRQSGYYIYYEKNDDMQNYIIDHNPSKQNSVRDAQDATVNEFKDEIREQRVQENNKSILHLMYAAGSLMAVIVIIVFATMINNNTKIRNLESSVDAINNTLSASMKNEPNSESVVDTSTSTESSMEVETISGNLNSIKNEEVIGDRSDEAMESEDVTEDENNETNNHADEQGEEQVTESSQEEVQAVGEEQEDSSQEASSAEEPTGENETSQSSEIENEETETTSNNSEIQYYEVQKGDSLVGISLKLYGTVDYVSKIMELNGIEDMDVIYYGQKLIVP